jgi:hypothetical protein
MSQKKAVAVERLFRDMSSREKLVFVGKATIFFVSGGFIYPTLWID